MTSPLPDPPSFRSDRRPAAPMHATTPILSSITKTTAYSLERAPGAISADLPFVGVVRFVIPDLAPLDPQGQRVDARRVSAALADDRVPPAETDDQAPRHQVREIRPLRVVAGEGLPRALPRHADRVG